jgi:hypothetical protein
MTVFFCQICAAIAIFFMGKCGAILLPRKIITMVHFVGGYVRVLAQCHYYFFNCARWTAKFTTHRQRRKEARKNDFKVGRSALCKLVKMVTNLLQLGARQGHECASVSALLSSRAGSRDQIPSS